MKQFIPVCYDYASLPDHVNRGLYFVSPVEELSAVPAAETAFSRADGRSCRVRIRCRSAYRGSIPATDAMTDSDDASESATSPSINPDDVAFYNANLPRYRESIRDE
jgi:hypothetical protein